MKQRMREFGRFRFDSEDGTLSQDGIHIALGQRAAAVLAALVEAGGTIVSKSDLMEKAWPGTIVEEGNLTVQISTLRKILGTDELGRDWITTVPRRGYRLLTTPAGTQQTKPNVAVLPFKNLSSAPDEDYFADGVVEDIITTLSRFRAFSVIARNSSFAFRGGESDPASTASELAVRYIVHGSVRRAGKLLRITAQLIESTSGETIWSDHFDGTTEDVFAFQDRISVHIASAVAPEIQAAEFARARLSIPGSANAYDTYLRAMPLILSERQTDNAKAYNILSVALENEPDNPLLLGLGTWALEHRCTMGWAPLTKDDRQRCLELAKRGLEQTGGDTPTSAHCAISLIQVGKDYDLGMAVLRAALDANPNNLLVVTAAGVGHLHCGDLDDALECFHRANRLSPRDPLAHIALNGIAAVHLFRSEFETALDFETRALAINQQFDPIYWGLIAANAQLGRMDAAKAHLARLTELVPGVTIASIRKGQPAKDPSRMEPIYQGLHLAGMSPGEIKDF